MSELFDTIYQYADNFIRNVGGAADGMTLKRWIRMIAIVGAYILLRPYLEKLSAYVMAENHEKELDPEEMDKANKAKLSPNALSGEVDSDAEEESATSGADWGKKARKRQRTVLQKIQEAEDKLRAEDSDEDIKEFLESDALVDYKEGEDGW